MSTKITITIADLSDLIDSAFALGKTYATHEISSMRNVDFETPKPDTPEYYDFIEGNGGDTLYSGDAKTDIAWKYVSKSMRKDFYASIDFD